MSGASQRLDKWLWHARLSPTRTAAQALIAAGRVRVNRIVVAKPSAAVAAGDVLTLPQGGRIRVVRVLALAERRRSATVARRLYDDLDGRPGPGLPMASPV